MQYTDFILDFAQRTYENLLIIEKKAAGDASGDDKAYEVTQLINSFVGLLVFPQQKYFTEIPKEFPNDSIKRAFQQCESTYPADNRLTYKNMIRHLRNAVSHQELSVYPVYSVMKTISQFKFKDKDVRSDGNYTFEVVLDIKTLREILVEMLKFIYGKARKDFPY